MREFIAFWCYWDGTAGRAAGRGEGGECFGAADSAGLVNWRVGGMVGRGGLRTALVGGLRTCSSKSVPIRAEMRVEIKSTYGLGLREGRELLNNSEV